MESETTRRAELARIAEWVRGCFHRGAGSEIALQMVVGLDELRQLMAVFDGKPECVAEMFVTEAQKSAEPSSLSTSFVLEDRRDGRVLNILRLDLGGGRGSSAPDELGRLQRWLDGNGCRSVELYRVGPADVRLNGLRCWSGDDPGWTPASKLAQAILGQAQVDAAGHRGVVVYTARAWRTGQIEPFTYHTFRLDGGLDATRPDTDPSADPLDKIRERLHALQQMQRDLVDEMVTLGRARLAQAGSGT
jgi:hypothetical protein